MGLREIIPHMAERIEKNGGIGAAMALPEPVLCLVCRDSGMVIAKAMNVRRSQWADVRPFSLAGRVLEPDEIAVNCHACDPVIQRSRHLAGSMPPGDILRCRFNDYTTRTDAQVAGKAFAVAWATWADPRPLLVLTGPPGVGKSHLAKAAILYRAEHGERVIWETAEGVLTAIRATFDTLRDEGASEPLAQRMTLDAWAKYPVLAIDDIGAGYATGWNMAAIETVITERYEHQRPTVITSNYDLASLGRADDPFARLMSRLSDAERVIFADVQGPDFRQATDAR